MKSNTALEVVIVVVLVATGLAARIIFPDSAFAQGHGTTGIFALLAAWFVLAWYRRK